MPEYRPPIDDMLFNLRNLMDLSTLDAAEDLDDETMEAILTEAGRLATDVLSPLNWNGDQQGSVLLDNHDVKTPDGFKDAYKQYQENGWNGVPFNPEYGGQGLPWALSFAVQEMWQSANMSFGLCPMLNQAAVDALDIHGTEEQKNLYLEKLISGEWTGTMNLTEPQAGSDLAALRTKAEPQDDGTYLIRGQKIYITYGEHGFTENIIHMVLARTPDAPEGVKGISLFLVPKFILDENGNPAKKNDVVCTKLEEKLGIHASPTCVMMYGENEGATGYLIGKENEGLKLMFTMMNNARLSVGLQGVAIAERAYQHALNYAEERIQGKRIDSKDGENVAIAQHPDVQRMLLSMQSQIHAGRSLSYYAAYMLDRTYQGDEKAKKIVDLLTPVVKSWCTDMACDVTSTGVQIHGGMGFIEETGAAQYFRDARITPIYEGTNGIQAQDLAFRKILMDGGAAFALWADDQKTIIAQIKTRDEDMAQSLTSALEDLSAATNFIVKNGAENMAEIAGVSMPYLNAFGITAAAIMLGHSAAILMSDDAQNGDASYKNSKIRLARFYLSHHLPHAIALAHTVQHGHDFVQ